MLHSEQDINTHISANINSLIQGFRVTAYVPTMGETFCWEPVGFPDWLGNDRYDIVAKISIDKSQPYFSAITFFRI